MEFVRPKSVREHEVQGVTRDFKKTACFAPFRQLLDFLGGSQRLAYIERNRMPCAQSKSVGNFLRWNGEGSEAPTPQTEQFIARQA